MLSKSILIVLFASLTCSTILPSQIDFSQIPLLKNENYHQYGSSVKSAKENSVHIFNAVHSAMRQWGSSYHHNGMSIIPAIVPAGINFYHGGGDSERIIGMEWLAFEVEHAEVFARSRGPPRDGDKGPDGNPRGPPRGAPGNHPSQLELIEYQSLDALEDPSPPRRPIMNAGYFHTYRTNRLLNLLYLDGMAAAKCSIGTLDTQDILLLNRNARTEPIWRDGQRGLDLCALGKLWKMPIDGFIRMEAGFEIIHCDFSTAGGLDFIEARKRPQANETYGIDNGSHFEYMRAVASRHHGIDASRVELKYDAMISAYFYPLNLTNPDPDKQILPRLPFEETLVLETMRHDLKHAFLQTQNRKQKQEKPDWQGMVDMIIARYAERLQFIASDPGFEETMSLINVLINTFINYEDFSKAESIDKCTKNYFTPAEAFEWNGQDHLLATAILDVSSRICETLFDVREDLLKEEDEGNKTALVVNKIKDLIAYLDWATWKECGKCAYNEVCFISVWPFGGAQDHYNPGCRNQSSLQAGGMKRDEYWGRMM